MEELTTLTGTVTELRFALDTFYFLLSGVLVMWMAAGFAMLEAGMVRSKNTTEILTKNIALYSIACVMFLLVGYNIMYVDNAEGGILPSIAGLIGTQAEGADHSLESDFFFQVVFVATAMSIVSGAVAERMKLWAFLIFTVVLTGFIYPVEGYWTWGGGFLSEAGFSDFAGSGIVHMAGAAAALAGVLLLGARKGKYGKNGEIFPIPGSNMPLATLGTFILWMGWFGFNGGSQLLLSDAENATAVGQIFVNTNAAAAAGAVAALLLNKVIWGKADLTMILNGALAGLVTITADPLSPSPLFASLLGALGGMLVVLSITSLDKVKIDDPVGAISVHGVVGFFALMVVPFSNGDATFGAQLYGAFVIFAWVFAASFAVWFVLKKTMGIRVSEDEEYNGVDKSDCGVEAYPEFVSLKG
ncbi:MULTISPECIES: ammonium transporter [unclassified Thalassotalea]|uniref:ammonium transporter n=1 Tax=unclassified Thalassotalea TaxID=2614972 RepID=UPI0010819E3B|nr:MULTISPECIES: ammonium transporter [unclassified Thalassotalea]NMP15817.1 ammonium transporter [Thalassotalea sp. Y01]QBY04861.1 ammonium transporter [Thalassotalea sp. HSM 43]